MSGPWERYQQEAGPWTKYAAPASPKPAAEVPAFEREAQRTKMIAADLMTSPPMAVARGVKDLIDTGAGFLSRLGGKDEQSRVQAENSAGRAEFDAAAGGNILPQVARVGGSLLVVNPILSKAGQVVAKAAPRLGAAISSGGASTGAVPVGVKAKAADLAIRTAGGGAAGFAGAGMVNPDEATTGGMIGAALPGVLQFLGKFGSVAGGVFKPRDAKAGADLAKALDLLTPADRAAVIAQLRAAPELVQGSRPTVAQALGTPQAGILERVVSDSAGGAALKNQQVAQNVARLSALEGVAPTVPTGFATARQDMGEALNRYATAARGGKRAQTSALYKSVPQDEAALYPPDLKAIRDEFYPPGAFTDRSAVDKAVATAEKLGTVIVQPPKLPSATAAGRVKDLAQAVRSAGGIDPARAGGLAGELRSLTGDIKNMVKRGGLSMERMAEKMQQLGYIKDNSVDTLIDALKNNSRSGRQFSVDDLPEAAWERAKYADAPINAESVPVKMTLADIEAMRKSLGQEARQAAMKGDDTAAKALGRMKAAIDDRIDEVVRGDGRVDEVLPIDWADKLSAARKSKLEEVQRFGTGPQADMFRKGADGSPLLQGGEVAAKFWGNRPGLSDDVKSLRRLIQDEPSLLGQFRSMVTTEGASTATNAGNLTGKFVRWVDNVLPGLKAGFDPDQVRTLQRIAQDIKRSESAAAAGMSRGSNTYQNAQNALNLGLLDNPLVSVAANRVPFAGAGIDWIRESATKGKARRLAEVLADSETAANALLLSQPRAPGALNALSIGLLRGAPVALTGRGQ